MGRHRQVDVTCFNGSSCVWEHMPTCCMLAMLHAKHCNPMHTQQSLLILLSRPTHSSGSINLNHQQADNTVRVINTASMRVEATVHGLRPAPLPPVGRPAGGCALLQPGTGYLVVSGPNSLLQFFDATREQHAARLQVRSACRGRGINW